MLWNTTVAENAPANGRAKPKTVGIVYSTTFTSVTGPSSPSAPASELSCRCSCGSASKRSSAPASPARGACVGVVTAASPSDADALEFTEAMAGEMTLDALKELSQVLQRLIHERNAALIDLLQHRDELLHERMGDVSCGVSHTLAASAIVEETTGDGNDKMKVRRLPATRARRARWLSGPCVSGR